MHTHRCTHTHTRNAMWGPSFLQAKKAGLTRHLISSTLILDFTASRAASTAFSVFKPPSLWHSGSLCIYFGCLSLRHWDFFPPEGRDHYSWSTPTMSGPSSPVRLPAHLDSLLESLSSGQECFAKPFSLVPCFANTGLSTWGVIPLVPSWQKSLPILASWPS